MKDILVKFYKDLLSNGEAHLLYYHPTTNCMITKYYIAIDLGLSKYNEKLGHFYFKSVDELVIDVLKECEKIKSHKEKFIDMENKIHAFLETGTL